MGGVNQLVLAVLRDGVDVVTAVGDAVDAPRVAWDESDIGEIARFDQQMRLFCHIDGSCGVPKSRSGRCYAIAKSTRL